MNNDKPLQPNVAPTRIAFVVQERLGDTIFHLPAIDWIKQTFPNVTLDAFVPTELSREVLSNHPAINNYYSSENHDLLMAKDNIYDVLLAGHYNDFVIKVENCLKLQKFTPTVTPLPTLRAKSILNYVQLALVGAIEDTPLHYQLFPEERDLQFAENLLRQHGVESGQLIVGCHIGCHGLAKRSRFSFGRKGHKKVWSPQRYKEFIQQLTAQHRNAHILLTGSKNEKRIAKLFRNMPGVIDLVGETSIHQLQQLISKCIVYVTPDTGSLHLACSTSTPVAALFSVTDPAIYGPPPARPATKIFRGESVDKIAPSNVIDWINHYFS